MCLARRMCSQAWSGLARDLLSSLRDSPARLEFHHVSLGRYRSGLNEWTSERRGRRLIVIINKNVLRRRHMAMSEERSFAFRSLGPPRRGHSSYSCHSFLSAPSPEWLDLAGQFVSGIFVKGHLIPLNFLAWRSISNLFEQRFL